MINIFKKFKVGDIVRHKEHSKLIGEVTEVEGNFIRVDGFYNHSKSYDFWVARVGEPVWFWREDEFDVMGCFPKFGYYGITTYDGMDIIKPFFGKDPTDMFMTNKGEKMVRNYKCGSCGYVTRSYLSPDKCPRCAKLNRDNSNDEYFRRMQLESSDDTALLLTTFVLLSSSDDYSSSSSYDSGSYSSSSYDSGSSSSSYDSGSSSSSYDSGSSSSSD